MAVEGQDGQQYVVLEVFQLSENSTAGGATIKVEAGQQAKGCQRRPKGTTCSQKGQSG